MSRKKVSRSCDIMLYWAHDKKIYQICMLNSRLGSLSDPLRNPWVILCIKRQIFVRWTPHLLCFTSSSRRRYHQQLRAIICLLLLSLLLALCQRQLLCLCVLELDSSELSTVCIQITCFSQTNFFCVVCLLTNSPNYPKYLDHFILTVNHILPHSPFSEIFIQKISVLRAAFGFHPIHWSAWWTSFQGCYPQWPWIVCSAPHPYSWLTWR